MNFKSETFLTLCIHPRHFACLTPSRYSGHHLCGMNLFCGWHFPFHLSCVLAFAFNRIFVFFQAGGMGYSCEVQPRIFYGKKQLNTHECDSLAAKLAKPRSSESNNETDEETKKKKKAKKGKKG